MIHVSHSGHQTCELTYMIKCVNPHLPLWKFSILGAYAGSLLYVVRHFIDFHFVFLWVIVFHFGSSWENKVHSRWMKWRDFKELIRYSCPALCDSIDYSPRLLCPWNSPGENTGVDMHSLIQGIFPTQRFSLGLLHCRQILYYLNHEGRPNFLSGQGKTEQSSRNEGCRWKMEILWLEDCINKFWNIIAIYIYNHDCLCNFLLIESI